MRGTPLNDTWVLNKTLHEVSLWCALLKKKWKARSFYSFYAPLSSKTTQCSHGHGPNKSMRKMDLVEGGVLLGEAVEVVPRNPVITTEMNKGKIKEDDKSIQIRKKAADTAKKLLSKSNSLSCTSKPVFMPKKIPDDEDDPSGISNDSLDNMDATSNERESKSKDSGLVSSPSPSPTISSPDSSFGTAKSSTKEKPGKETRLSRNAIQIEALLKRIHEENRKTREVLQIIQKNSEEGQEKTQDDNCKQCINLGVQLEM